MQVMGVTYHNEVVSFVSARCETETSNKSSSSVGQNISIHVRGNDLIARVNNVSSACQMSNSTYDVVVLRIANHFVHH